MEIIDCQIHDALPVKPIAPHLGDDVEKLLACELAREAMDSIGVDAALVVARPNHAHYVDYFIARYPDRFVGCATVDPNAPDVESVIAGLRERPGMLALRISIVNWYDGSVRREFTEGSFERIFTAAEAHQVPVAVLAAGVTGVVGPVAAQHPDLQLIIDHLGATSPPPMAFVSREDHFASLPDILALAKYPNVAMKFSGATVHSREPYPHKDLWPILHKIVDAYGPDRLMWGSDFTRMRMKAGSTDPAPRQEWASIYSNDLNYLRDTTEISQHDKEAILGGTFRKVLGWPKRHEHEAAR